jgi:hypothetical protein
MKKLLYVLPLTALFLASCGGTNTEDDTQDTALNETPETQEDFEAAVVSFADGEASTGEEYFSGVLAEVIEVDVKYNEIDRLDEMNAEVAEFNAVIDSGLVLIADARVALDLYKDKDWPKRQELHDLTLEWLAAMEGLFNNHLKGLATAMSKPDEEWTKAEQKQFDAYLEAVDAYYEVDGRWVDFQYAFAAANGFEFGEETVDVEALVDEDLEKSGH